MRVDTSAWSKFRIGDLFELYKGTRLTKANMIEGDIRFVSAANVNNGVTAHIGNNEHVHSEGTLTVCYNGNGGTGKAFYQDKPYWASDDVHVLYPKFHLPEDFEGVEWTGLNSTVGLFLAAAIEKVGRQKYNYTDKWKLEYMREDQIRLPVKDDGTPDWERIEHYMSAVVQDASVSANDLLRTLNNRKSIELGDWNPFTIDELFTIKKGTRLTKSNMKPGEIRFIGSSAINNGCTVTIGNDEHLHPANTITVCYNGSVGEAFYQDCPFWASDDVNVLYPKFEMSRSTALFIVPLIRAIGKRYGYTDKWKTEVMAQDKIMLPVLPNRSLNLDYMESFMHNVMEQAESTLDALGAVISE